MDDHDYKSLIQYYGREKFYHSMQSSALEALSRFPGENIFRLYNGIALILGNRIQEGIRELNPIQSDRDCGMSAILGLMYGHKRCTVIDKEALINFDGKLKEERKKLTSNSAYYSAVFLFHSGKVEKAREYAEKSLKFNPDFSEAIILKGWCELSLSTRVNKSILELFDRALQFGKSIDGSIGQMKFFQMNNDFERAISVLNKLSVRYPELNIPLVEKMKTQLSSWNWEHSLETAHRILNLEPTNIEALRVRCLVVICRDGNYSDGAAGLQVLFKAVEKSEPTNTELYLQISQLFSRVCGRNILILDETNKFAEKAVQLSPGNADYLTEMGYHSVYFGKYKEATKYFRSATKLDDSSIYALCGLTLCQLIESGPCEQVSQQIEFLTEIQGPNKIPLLLWMSAKMIQNNSDQAIAQLTQSCEIQFKNLKTLSYGPEYLRKFNPDFLLQVTNELLHYSPIQSTISFGSSLTKENLHISLKHSLNILETVVKACPGLVQGVFQLARVQFLSGEVSSSAATLQKILHEIDPTYTEAHLLISQIHIHQKSHQRAAQSLEVCLSHNFKVRENPMYHLLQGIVQKSQSLYEECLKSFITASSLCGFGDPTTKLRSPSKKLKDIPTLSLSDKVTLYLEMIETYILMEQGSEANKLMEIATEEFSRTPEEGRIIIANSNLLLQQGDIAKSIELLKNIEPGQPYYLQAKTKLANVYLHQKKDRLLFAQCFKELVENCPDSESYLMLGDAFMSIQEPDQAIEAYRQALRQNPSDSILISKLGRAYVKTHQYTKAINYYKDATTSPENFALKLDLAELFLKLKQFSNAEQVLMEEIEESKKEETDLTVLQTRTKQLLLLARVREKAGHLQASLSTLKEARDNQYRVQKRINLEHSGGIEEQQRILSRICVLMAEHSISLRDNSQAIHHFNEALKCTPQEISIMAALARLYMQVNNMDECQQTCTQIFHIDSNNEGASVMMADLSFRRVSHSSIYVLFN